MSTKTLSSKWLGNKKSSLSSAPVASSPLRFVGLLLGFLVLGSLAVYGFFSWRESKNEKANLLLSEALKVYQADLLTEKDVSVSTSSAIPRFHTKLEREQATLALLDKIKATYPSGQVLLSLETVRAGVLFEMKKFADAEPLLRSQIQTTPTVVKPFLQDTLGVLLETTGRNNEAISLYKQNSGKGTSFYQPLFLLSQTRFLRNVGDKKQALEQYQQLSQVADWSSSYKTYIQNRLIDLE